MQVCLKHLVGYLTLVLLVCCLQYKNVTDRIFIVDDAYIVRGDAYQHNSPYWKFFSDQCLQDDYISNYYLSAIVPTGLRLLFSFFAKFFSPPKFTTIFSYLLSFGFILAMAASARRISGWWGAFLTVFFSVGFLTRNFIFGAAISRSFGYFICALAIYALLQKSLIILAILSCIGILFYPPSAAFVGMCFALLLLTKFDWEAKKKSLIRAFLSLFLLLLFLCLLALPQLSSGKFYGKRLSPRDSDKYQEVGENGRYSPTDRGIVELNLFQTFFSGLRRTFLIKKPIGSFFNRRQQTSASKRTSRGNKHKSKSYGLRGIVFFVSILIAISSIFLRPFRKSKIDLISFLHPGSIYFFAAGVCFYLAVLFFPWLYMPSRYTSVSFPAFSLVFLPSLFVLSFSQNINKLRSHIQIFWLSLFLILLSGVYEYRVPRRTSMEQYSRLFNYLHNLPAKTLVAGWPLGLIDAVPYFSCKPVLLSYEMHQVFHEDYILEMRRRMHALTAAYLSSEIEPISKLKNEFGVTHLLVEDHYYSKRPWYFSPFKKEIEQKFEANPKENRLKFFNSLSTAIVYQQAGLKIYDLDKLKRLGFF